MLPVSLSSRTRNTQGLSGNVGYSRGARCFRIVKNLLHRSKNSPFPASPKSEPKADSRWKDSLFVAQRHRTPSQHSGAGSSATSTCDRSRHPQVPAAARGSATTLIVVHLKQPFIHTHVHEVDDEGLDFQAFPGQGVLVVPVTIVRGVVPSACRREGVG